MKAKNILAAVGVVVTVIVLAIAAITCTGNFPAHTHDAGDIISGQLSNSRLNMGSGTGLDADMVDGKHAYELGQVSQEPSQILVVNQKSTTSNDWVTFLEDTGGGYLYALTSYYRYGQVWFPDVRITLDGIQSYISMSNFTTGGYYEYGEQPVRYAQCNLKIRFNSSLKIEYKSPSEGIVVPLNVVYSTDR